MDFQSVLIIIIVAVIAFLTFYVIGIYNKLVNSSNLVNDKWQEIDKLLTNKIQLISKLVEVVKNYAKAEEALFNMILSNKNRVNNAISINDKIDANASLNKNLNDLINLDKNYDELAEDSKFKSLIEDINSIDSSINYAKEFYNDFALKHNKMIEKFPASLVAKSFSFKSFELFK